MNGNPQSVSYDGLANPPGPTDAYNFDHISGSDEAIQSGGYEENPDLSKPPPPGWVVPGTTKLKPLIVD